MRSWSRLLSSGVVAASIVCHSLAASPQGSPTTYMDAIELYRQGDEELALRKLRGITADEISRGRQALFTGFVSKRPEESERAAARMRAAVLLHTALAFGALDRNNQGEFRYHFTTAQTYVDKLGSKERRLSFVRMWRLLVLALFHEGRSVLAADQFGHRAHDPEGDSAELLLALGATEEMAWSIRHEDDADPGMNGDLKNAERQYRQALVVNPSLVEARLRLGRVLALRDDPEGMNIFAQIGESTEAGYQYLARLFEGDVFERGGDVAEAERRYSTAVSIIPSAQSAHIALAHLHHAHGDRTKAAQEVRSSANTEGTADTADPWYWYARGTASRAGMYVEELLRMIR